MRGHGQDQEQTHGPKQNQNRAQSENFWEDLERPKVQRRKRGAFLAAARSFHFSITPALLRFLLAPTLLLLTSHVRAQTMTGFLGQKFTQANVTYDLSSVHDSGLQKQIATAIALGYQQAAQGGSAIKSEIAGLRGNGKPRTIQFFSNELEQNPGGGESGAPASAIWQGPQGTDDMVSSPSTRTNIRILMKPGQPYWYLVNSVWHELLHTTLKITHDQTTPEGTMPQTFVNDQIWYTTIEKIMLDFPKTATDPVSGQVQELYNLDDSPWS